MENTNNTVKMTKAEKFAMIKDFLTTNGADSILIDTINHEIDLVNKKKSYKRTTLTKTQRANVELEEIVLDVVTNLQEGTTVSEIIKSDERISNFSTQKINPRLKSLVEKGLVKKSFNDKGKAIYQVA